MRLFWPAGQWLLDLIFPKFCVVCGREGSFCCDACARTLEFAAPACPVCHFRNGTGILCDPCAGSMHIRRLLAPFLYRDRIIRELIHTYKYTGARELAGFFAGEIVLFLDSYAIRPIGPAVLVPLPLHKRRRRERGFDQARLLAERISERWGMPTADALIRLRPTAPQAGLESFEKRRENMKNAFGVMDASLVAGKTAILVDDVITSGTTMREAAKALRDAGCRTVWGITIAKG